MVTAWSQLLSIEKPTQPLTWSQGHKGHGCIARDARTHFFKKRAYGHVCNAVVTFVTFCKKSATKSIDISTHRLLLSCDLFCDPVVTQSGPFEITHDS